jgi:hypothetical protein
VERLFKTFQDRLSKEMRLARIATLEGANCFLEHYLPVYNRRFMVPPAPVTDLHRPTPSVRDLDRCLCLKTTRCLRKDVTIAHAGPLYQIHDTIRARHVLVEQRLDGRMRLTHQGRPLNFHAIAVRPVSVAESNRLPRSPRSVTPRPNHPWRNRRNTRY